MILLTGANGVIGRALLPNLVRNGTQPVRAFVRREFDAVRLRDRGAEAVVGDLLTGRGLDAAMRGIETLVYLVHVLDRPSDIVARDLAAAQNAALAARAAGVQRVVFLGHVAASDEASAQYLVARWAVERALTQSGLSCCVLRAPVVIGRGSEPFSVLRRLVDRSPVVPLFNWRRTSVEPVALGDVVQALEMAVADPELDGRSFDICGQDRMTYGALLREYARASGRRRLFAPVRGRGEAATAYASWVLARRPPARTRLLLETLRERQVCTDPSRRFPLPQRPAPFRRALADVL